jgi:DNA-directed RNA polymerase alpha subunit
MSVDPKWDCLVSGLDLSRRTLTALRDAHILTLLQLTQMTEARLLKLPRFGQGCLNEIRKVLVLLGVDPLTKG